MQSVKPNSINPKEETISCSMKPLRHGLCVRAYLAILLFLSIRGTTAFSAGYSDLQALIKRTRSLVTAPAHGPTMQFEMDLSALFKDIRSLTGSAGPSAVWPDDLGSLKMQAEMRGGKLATRTSFNIAKMGRLLSALQALAAGK